MCRDELQNLKIGQIIHLYQNGLNDDNYEYIVLITNNKPLNQFYNGRFTIPEKFTTFEDLKSAPFGGFLYDECIRFDIITEFDCDLGL